MVFAPPFPLELRACLLFKCEKLWKKQTLVFDYVVGTLRSSPMSVCKQSRLSVQNYWQVPQNMEMVFVVDFVVFMALNVAKLNVIM